MAAEGGSPQRLSNSSSIDTEPNFSPDGQWILFTSDRGSPQIYRMPATGGIGRASDVRRLLQRFAAT